MDAEVGQWSARRRRVNERVSAEQAHSVRIGLTELHDDALTLSQWALSINAKSGKIAANVFSGVSPDDMGKSVLELAALCHSFLESLDRRRD